MTGSRFRKYNKCRYILQVILITFESLLENCVAHQMYLSTNHVGQNKDSLREPAKDTHVEDIVARTNVLRSDMAPWQIVALKEDGFDLTEEELTKFRIWPSGIIPYYIDDYSFDKIMRNRLELVMEAVNSVTGLRFSSLSSLPKSEDERYLLFLNRRGALACQDYTPQSFTTKGVQKVVVGYDCIQGGSLAPTILALLGVPPQHNSPDRNNYITVNKDYILPDKTHLFEKIKDNEWLFHDINYDFHSAGHYDFHKYTLNGSATIIPKMKLNSLVGEGGGFSYNDILKVKMLYNYLITKKVHADNIACSQLFNIRNNSHYKETHIKMKKARKKPAKYITLQKNDIHNKNKKLKLKLSMPNFSPSIKKLSGKADWKRLSGFFKKNSWEYQSDFDTSRERERTKHSEPEFF